MNIQLALAYYGLAVAILLPVLLVFVIIYAKKGGRVEAFNKWLDKRLGIQDKTPENTDNKKTAETDKKEQDKKPEVKKKKKPNDWEENQKYMTCLRLKTGDSYMLLLTESEKDDVGNYREWTCSEPFVGKVNENTSVFTALKTGKTYIECGEVRIYYIEVSARQKGWFAENEYDMFIEGSSYDEIIEMNKDKTIFENNSKKRVTFRTSDDINLTIEFDTEGNAVRFLFRLTDSDNIRKAIEDALSERMNILKTKIPEVSFWVHMKGRVDKDSVDHAAFCMGTSDGSLYFGFGKNWRAEGQIDEFKANPIMFMRTFEDMMPSVTLPDNIAIIERKTRSGNKSKKDKQKEETSSFGNDAQQKTEQDHHDENRASWYESTEDDDVDTSVNDDDFSFDD